MVFSIVFSRQPSPALLFFKLIEAETKFPFANSISEFSRSQDPNRTSALWVSATRGCAGPATTEMTRGATKKGGFESAFFRDTINSGARIPLRDGAIG